jgi:hypothetical protein
MGRGRAKAKQQKVARELKYSTPHTDLSALERELHAGRNGGGYLPYADDKAEDDPGDIDDDIEDIEDVDDLDEDADDGDDYEKWATGQR